MAYTIFYPAQVPAGTVTPVKTVQYVASPSANLVRGAVLTLTAGEVDAAGTNPTDIYGVALQDAGTNPGFNNANSPTVNTGRKRTVSIVRPLTNVVFAGLMTNGSAAYVTPVQADIGAEYGITAYGSGATRIWTVDKNKTAGDARVVVTGFEVVPGGPSYVLFQFLASAVI
jgi:hypothetical protein